ncbi:MAG: peptidoglycan-binding protein [Pirellulales bacterium]
MKTISATVGRASRNEPIDVIRIQELLNNVSPGEGGPTPQLEVDGLCGPKTQHAIQTFQLKHFGFKGADGRVEPGKQTLAKLNEINDRQNPALPPAQPPPKPETLFTSFSFQQTGKAGTLASGDEDFFFRVTGFDDVDKARHDQRDYFLGRPQGSLGVARRPVFEQGSGVPLTFVKLKPPGFTLSDLHNSFGTFRTEGGKRATENSTLFLRFKKGDGTFQIQVRMLRHLFDNLGPTAGGFSTREGVFQTVPAFQQGFKSDVGGFKRSKA